jgi:hypothetical protein
MRRFLFVLFVAAAACASALEIAACSAATADATAQAAADASHLDGGQVQAPEAGAYEGGGPEGPEPSCAAYCQLVMTNCTGPDLQYASLGDCQRLCSHLTAGDAGDAHTSSVACRQYYAGSPARTDARSYCLAAGPSGGGVCGDRCTAFCGLALGACPPAGAAGPFLSYPDCQTACAGYPYRDAGADGGGEGVLGPAAGDTLNCRLFHLRAAVADGTGCADLGVDSGACR